MNEALRILEEAGRSPLYNPITFLVGLLISFCLSYYFFWKSNRKKKPLFSIKSRNLIRDYTSKINKLQIKYEGMEVKSLTVSRLLFWNDGSETIDGSDITFVEPIKIQPKHGIDFLDAEIITRNEHANAFKIRHEEGCILLSFDYLDKSQGAVMQIFHTGTQSSDILVTGKIKGSLPIEHKALYSTKLLEGMLHSIPIVGNYLTHDFKSKHYRLISLTACAMLLISGLAILVFDSSLKNGEKYLIAGLFFTYSIPFYLIGSKAAPKGLEAIYEEF